MNLNKARDFYSDHYEGKLEAGLRQAFERAMAADPHIEADYREFCAAMEQLNDFGKAEVEIPFDLHETLSAKLDKHIYDTKQVTNRPGIFSWRLPLYGAVAATALVGTFFAINRQGTGGPSEAGFVPAVTENVAPPELSVENGTVQVVYRGRQSQTVSVREESTGKILQEIKIGVQDVSNPIKNERADAVIVLIEFSDKSDSIRLVIPGTRANPVLKGVGKLADLGLAIAETYRVPVLLPSETGTNVTWEFKPSDTVETLPAALSPSKVLVETRSNGFLALSR